MLSRFQNLFIGKIRKKLIANFYYVYNQYSWYMLNKRRKKWQQHTQETLTGQIIKCMKWSILGIYAVLYIREYFAWGPRISIDFEKKRFASLNDEFFFQSKPSCLRFASPWTVHILRKWWKAGAYLQRSI